MQAEKAMAGISALLNTRILYFLWFLCLQKNELAYFYIFHTFQFGVKIRTW